MGISARRHVGLESALAAIVSFAFIMFAAAPMRPVVMQDEFVYRQQVLTQKAGEFDYPNYLFSLAAWVSEQAGENFYLFIKMFNSLAAGVAVGVLFYVLATLYSRVIALLASLVFVFFPAVSQASFYMPDMFVSAFLLATMAMLLLGLHQDRGLRAWIWILSALPLTLAFLSKPHTLIAIGGLILFSLIDSVRSRRLSPVLLTVGLALFARLIIGFAFAGTSGVNIFGKSYSENLLGTGTQHGSGQVSASGTEMTAGPTSAVNPNIFASFGWEFLQLFGAVGFVTLGLVVPVMIFWKRSRTNLLVSVVVLTSIGGIAFFETLVGLSGDDHSVRILTRHVEYLIPLIFAVGLPGLSTVQRSNKLIMFSTIGLVSAVLAVGWAVLSGLPSHRISDGTTVVLTGLWGGGFLLLVAFIGVLLWIGQIFESRWSEVVLSSALVLSSFFAFWEVRSVFSIDTEVDQLGRVVMTPGFFKARNVLVVSDSKADAELFRFYLLPGGAEQRLFKEGTIVDMEGVEAPEGIFVPLGSIQLDTNCQAVQLGESVYYDCANLEK